ncbi:MAG: serine/threonine protein kinase [Acidimicrobiia bacterium]|nr:serine/threonine protein kinase [Acidimicrobiia bacterium]
MDEAVGPNGRWRLINTLGAGGFSTVYRALDTRFESPVAVKILAENYTNHVEVRERFLSEALLQRQLTGPVVPVYDTGETPSGQPFIVMPLADGGDLDNRVRSWRATAEPTSDDLYQLASMLSRAIGALHAQGVVHRDVKPSNLLLFGSDDERPPDQLIGPNETLLLGDLGFAKQLADGSGLTLGVGTPGFVPPEQRTPGRVDNRADIWAASAVVHWFLTGHPPNDSATIRANDLAAAGTGDELAAAIAAGMADDPARRPATIEEWYRSVRRALIPPLPVDSVTARRRRPLVAGVVAALVAAIAVIVIAGMAGVRLVNRSGAARIEAEVATAVTDGVVTTTADLDGSTVVITGPETIAVGETGTFTVELPEDISTWTWISPTGTHHTGEPSLAVRATRPGRGVVQLVISGATGETRVVAHGFDVVP